jgi:uncharacterized membrane protein
MRPIVPNTRTEVLVNLCVARVNRGTGTFTFGSDKSYLQLEFNPSLGQNVFSLNVAPARKTKAQAILTVEPIDITFCKASFSDKTST